MKTIFYILGLLVLSVILSSSDAASYIILEKSLPPVIGACLGGVLACTSIVISVLSNASRKTKLIAKNSEKFSRFVDGLEFDVKVLVACLVCVVFLPYLRTLDYPVTVSIFNLDPNLIKHKLFSTAEIFFASIAFITIFELVSILVVILKNMMSIHESGKET
jgi:hypothetical protein